MSKENTFYFSHDYNTRSDMKIQRLITKKGYLGYGLFWALIENLYNNANALPLEYDVIAFDLRTDEDTIKTLINDFDLFVIKDGFFGSDSVQRRLDERNLKSTKARQSALNRWKKPKEDANALPTQSDSNAIKENKLNENINEDIEVDILEEDDKDSKLLLKKVNPSSDLANNEYYKVAEAFRRLFIKNREEQGIKSHANLEKAKYYDWVDEIRLMIEKDKFTIDQLRNIYDFLDGNTEQAIFWKPNIQSIDKLRSQFDKLIFAMNKDKQKQKIIKKQNTFTA